MYPHRTIFAVHRFAIWHCLILSASWCSPTIGNAQEHAKPQFVDLSLLVAPDLPCTWPAGFPLFQINHYCRIGPLSAYNSDILTIDPNTGTQLDAPPHSIPLPGSNLPNAGPFGKLFTDKVPAWQFAGEACVVDCRELFDKAPNGCSPLVTKEHIMAWERTHRPLRAGDVVMLRSGFSDKYYMPFPEGRSFVANPVGGLSPGWPDPDPECMKYIASRNVMAVGTDSPSMGPIPDLAEPTHIAGLKHGMVFTEGATRLGRLPATGVFYCMLCPKHADGAANEGRAFAITESPLASQLIESTRRKHVLDLSLVLSQDLPLVWPGQGVGHHRQPYFKITFMYNPTLDSFQQTHMMDSHVGTHLVPPAYSLPFDGFNNRHYTSKVQEWLEDYEQRFGPRGTSDVTTDRVPISQTCGPACIIDVNHLVGNTDTKSWPASPEITPTTFRLSSAKTES